MFPRSGLALPHNIEVNYIIPHSLIPLFCIMLCYSFLQFYFTSILKVMELDLTLDSIIRFSQA